MVPVCGLTQAIRCTILGAHNAKCKEIYRALLSLFFKVWLSGGLNFDAIVFKGGQNPKSVTFFNKSCSRLQTEGRGDLHFKIVSGQFLLANTMRFCSGKEQETS